MTFDREATEFVLSSGRRFYANAGILGIAEDLDISYGYDGSVSMDGERFTADERKEIADYMIGLWRTWAAQS